MDTWFEMCLYWKEILVGMHDEQCNSGTWD